MFKKRPGTSGISGQLYETKLISLILFRLLHDERVEDFYLASNMDGIGAFDDICFKIKLAKHDRPIICFIQAKHKENDNTFLKLINLNDLVKWSNSITKIKQMFKSKKGHDMIFGEDFDKTDCLFILYTNANYGVDSCYDFVSKVAPLNDFIATSSNIGSQARYTEKDVEDIGLRLLNEEMIILVEHFVKFLTETDQSMNIMNDDLITRYHVILGNKVVDISEIQFDEQKPDLKWRLLTFKHKFFDTNDKCLAFFKKYLYKQMVKYNAKTKKKSVEETSVDKLFSAFLSGPSAITLSTLIKSYIIYKNGKLVLVTASSNEYTKQLEAINISPLIIDEAIAIAAKKILIPLKLKVPVAFGNLDLTIRGNPKKMEKRLNYLTDIINDLCQKYKYIEPYKVVTLDKTIDEGISSSNRVLGSLVGNILTYDKKTKLFQFTDDHVILENNARTLFSKLKTRINNVHEFRFDVKPVKFPTLSLDCSNMAREFLNRLVIYSKQGNHYEVEEIFKNEIDNKKNTEHGININTNSLFLYFYNEIQKWWLTPKTGSYLTKFSNIYQQAIENIVKEPQISTLQNTFNINNMKYFGYKFSDEALDSFKSLESLSRTFIVTNITTLTTLKVIQFIRKTCDSKYAVLDFKFILNMSSEDFEALKRELGDTENMVLIIIACDIPSSKVSYRRLNGLAAATEQKSVIIVTNNECLELFKEYFLNVGSIINDATQRLIDLSLESRKDVLKATTVKFQDQMINLDLLVDDFSALSIKGDVLNKIIHKNEILTVGEILTNSNYEEAKHLYIERKISQVSSSDLDPEQYNYNDRKAEHLLNFTTVQTVYDIKNDIVLLTAPPGMGKSFVITHISVKTKELDKSLWVLRVKFLDHAKQFYTWQESKTDIDALAALKFLCQVILKNNTVTVTFKELNERTYLDDCSGDEWDVFVLNVFLHCYNERKLIMLFDGFDEICPHYKRTVLKFLDVVKNYHNKNKMWVSSRPYSTILPGLKKVLGKSYKMKPIDFVEQEKYLKTIWRQHIIFEELSDVQLNNIISYMDFMSKHIEATNKSTGELNFKFRKVFYLFYDFIHSHFPHITNVEELLYIDQLSSRDESDTITAETDVAYTIDTAQSSKLQSKPNSLTWDIDTVLGTPLLLYLLADYFVNILKRNKSFAKWGTNINMLNIYEMFIERKLKNVLFQEKNGMDIYNPDIIMKYEKERDDYLRSFKNIAAAVLLNDLLTWKCFSKFDYKEEEIENIVNKMKNGTEKSGLISRVILNGIPLFIHKTFAEYFTAEFVCDILKNVNIDLDTQKLFYTAIYADHSHHIIPWIIEKRKLDCKLDDKIKIIEGDLPKLLSKYSEIVAQERNEI